MVVSLIPPAMYEKVCNRAFTIKPCLHLVNETTKVIMVARQTTQKTQKTVCKWAALHLGHRCRRDVFRCSNAIAWIFGACWNAGTPVTDSIF